MKRSETEIRNLRSNQTSILTGLCFNSHLPLNEKKSMAPASHFLKFLFQYAFGTFGKPHKLTHNPNFAKEPNFANALKQIITIKEDNYG